MDHLEDRDEIRKSNIIAVNPPLEMPLKDQLVDRYFAYITVNAEDPPPDMRLEGIAIIDLHQTNEENHRESLF